MDDFVQDKRLWTYSYRTKTYGQIPTGQKLMGEFPQADMVKLPQSEDVWTYPTGQRLINKFLQKKDLWANSYMTKTY